MKGPKHPLGIRGLSRKQLKGGGGLEHDHANAIDRRTPDSTRLTQKLGLRGDINDVRDPEVWPQK